MLTLFMFLMYSSQEMSVFHGTFTEKFLIKKTNGFSHYLMQTKHA